MLKAVKTANGSLNISENLDHGVIYTKLYSAIKKANLNKVKTVLQSLNNRDDLKYFCDINSFTPTLLQLANDCFNNALKAKLKKSTMTTEQKFHNSAEITCILANAANGRYPSEITH